MNATTETTYQLKDLPDTFPFSWDFISRGNFRAGQARVMRLHRWRGEPIGSGNIRQYTRADMATLVVAELFKRTTGADLPTVAYKNYVEVNGKDMEITLWFNHGQIIMDVDPYIFDELWGD